jgi:uncharacterized membrane protein
MEESLKGVLQGIALAVEVAAGLIIAVGALQALLRLLVPSSLWRAGHRVRREVWLQFARWLVLALEFELAADILRTAITPTWTDIGQLAAIAAIRTALNYFLERDLERAAEQPRRPGDEHASGEAWTRAGAVDTQAAA